MSIKLLDLQLKEILDIFSDMNLCDKNDDLSDDIVCEYSFKPTDYNVRITKKLFDILPDNWSVRYFEAGSDEEESCFDFTQHNYPSVEDEKK